MNHPKSPLTISGISTLPPSGIAPQGYFNSYTCPPWDSTEPSVNPRVERILSDRAEIYSRESASFLNGDISWDEDDIRVELVDMDRPTGWFACDGTEIDVNLDYYSVNSGTLLTDFDK